MERRGNRWNRLETTVSYKAWAWLTPTLTHVVTYELVTSGAEDRAMSGVRHIMVETSMEGRDAAIPQFLFRTDIMWRVTVSGQVSRPMAINAGSPAHDRWRNGTTRAAIGTSAGDGRGAAALKSESMGPTVVAPDGMAVPPS